MADNLNTDPQSLRRMSDADYEVAPGEPDVRGWTVVLGNDEKVGKVDDLLIEPRAGKVRYLDVDVDKNALGLDKSRHVLVPIARAQLDTSEEEVLVNGIDRASLLNLPDYTGVEQTRGYDERFRSEPGRDTASKRMTRSAEELRIGKRTEKQGEVRVGKHVETERVRQNVPLTREEVHIERRPVERAVGSSAEFRNDEVVIPVMGEEPVIGKRQIVKEEVVISKEPVTREETVEADVRHEEFDFKPSSDDVRVSGDVKNRRRGGE
jgi:uncharacterized protein (TIGR02271 family)